MRIGHVQLSTMPLQTSASGDQSFGFQSFPASAQYRSPGLSGLRPTSTAKEVEKARNPAGANLIFFRDANLGAVPPVTRVSTSRVSRGPPLASSGVARSDDRRSEPALGC